MKIASWILSILLVLFLAQAGYLIFDGLTDELGSADAILVLGSKVNLDGTLSRRLKARLDRGYELYRDRSSNTIIVSGGTGKENYPEAVAMADYLKDRGVPEESIFLDKEGDNTRMSSLNFKKLADERGFRSVILVSQYFHLTRAKLAFRQAGGIKVYSAHARMFPELREIYSVPREIVAFYVYLLHAAMGQDKKGGENEKTYRQP